MTETTDNGWDVLDAGRPVWSYTYAFSKGGTANCLLTRMGDGKLLVLSPSTRMPEGAFADMDALGEVGAVVATNGFHHLGLAEWRGRYPQARFFAPAKAIARIAKHNAAAGPLEPLAALSALLGDEVVIHEVASTKCGELWATMKVGDGYLWFVSDVLANIPTLPDSLFPRLIFKWSGSAPGYRVFKLALRFIVGDSSAVLQDMLRMLDSCPPSIVQPAHGLSITGDDVVGATRNVLQSGLQSGL